jgi:RNA polymerase sigma-70 factor (ECF subfamily)
MKISRDVVARLRDGDEAAFNETYYAYVRLVHYLVLTIVRDRGTAEDLVQEAFVKMFAGIGKLADPGKFQSWFLRIAKNLAFDHLRRTKADPAATASILPEDYSVPLPDPEPERFDFNGMLEPFENHVLNLHLVHRMSFRDIAEETGRTMSIVTKAYYEAIAKLRRTYRKGGPLA